jgi:type IX secretion system PorP/SprF family membrane protein
MGINNTFRLVALLLAVGAAATLHAQQLPARSPFAPNSFIWNPAMTAAEDEWEAGITHHQEWVGFEDAPRTSQLYGAYPFLDQNFSLGGFLQLDDIRPLQNNTIALTYAYKLRFGAPKRRRSAVRKEAQLSLGVMLAMQQTFIDGNDFLVRDAADPLQPIGELNLIKPNAGLGAYFASRPAGTTGKSYFFAGAGANQLLAQDIPFRETAPAGNLRRVFHGNATLGYRAHGNAFIIEPSLWLNAAGRNVRSSQFNLHIEYPAAFWTGLSYNLNQTLAIQAGYLLPGGMAKGDSIRIGLMGSFNMGSFGAARGLGYGFYLAYRAKGG